jgi:nucleoside-diphosphate-sugar epimerase
MKSTIVTGGLGNVGQWIVDGLADRGHYVTVLDVEHPGFHVEQNHDNITFFKTELTDLGQVEDAIRDIQPDNIVHLAAVPSLDRTTDVEVFENNVLAAYNVFKSAGRYGADIAAASTESVYGMAWAEETWVPDYLPVDEAHPLRPEEEYGASKAICERIGDMVARRYGVDVASIRMTWIQYPGTYMCLDRRDDLGGGAHGFWSYLDVRDAAAMYDAALSTSFDGHEAFLASAENTYLDRPTVDAIREVFGHVPEQCDLEGRESVFTSEKAREILGWTPSHSWETAADDDVSEPTFLDS